MPPSIPKEPPPSPPSPRSLLPTDYEQVSHTNVVLVGYTSNRKKQKHFFDGLAHAATTWVGRYGPNRTPLSVKLVPFCDVDEIPFPEKLNLHAIIHKRTDDMAAAVATADGDASARMQRLQNLLNNSEPFRPNFRTLAPKKSSPPSSCFPVVAVDPLEGVWRLVDRAKISKAVDRAFPRGHHQSCLPSFNNVRAVAWTQLPACQGSDAIRNALDGNLKFPIILKRRLACGTKASHEMVIAHDMEGALAAINYVFAPHITSSVITSTHHNITVTDAADHFATDLIAQEFITNHGGVIFKVYAIGTKIVVQPRASVYHNSKGRVDGYYCFDSQRLNRGSHFSFDSLTGYSKNTEAIMPSCKLAATIVAKLSKELGLSLIGVDLVYDVHSKNYYIVDVNYFPGYKGVSRAHEWMLHHICNLVWQRLENY